MKACTLIKELFPTPYVGNIKRPIPISKVFPLASRLITSPDIVMPGSAALSVALSTTIIEEWALILKPSIMISDRDWDSIDIEIVLKSITKVPKGWREGSIYSGGYIAC